MTNLPPLTRPSSTILLLSLAATVPLTYLFKIHPSSPLTPLSRTTHKSHEVTGIPSSFLHSRTLREFVNPRGFYQNAMGDTRTILLTKKEIGKLSDEEILARFSRGLWNGWSFWLEKCVLTFGMRVLGIAVAGRNGSGFPGVPTNGKELSSFPLEISRTKLPPQYSRLAGGNFMVLDIHLKNPNPTNSNSNSNPPTTDTINTSPPATEFKTGSYIDFAFGDSRGTFAGCHRFEVIREPNESDDDGGVTVVYSSIACNPTIETAKFSGILGWFHVVYARVLFWEGVAEILR